MDKNTENSPKGGPASSTGGFKGFNATGRDDTAAVVLRPHVDSAVRQRSILLIAFALVLLCVVAAIAYQRSHLSFTPAADQGPHFAPNSQQAN